MYAVIKTGGKQYKVSKDDIISVEKLSEDTGKKIKLNEVLIISDKGKPIVGDPLIKGASVEAEIMDCLLYTSPSPRDRTRSRMPSSA